MPTFNCYTEPYTAKQSALIVGIDPTDLQIALDRDFVKTTVVQVGARTYRRFTRGQLLSLLVFARMTEDGIKPSVAKSYVEQLEAAIPDLAHIRFMVFRSGQSPVFVAKNAPVAALTQAIEAGGWVLAYEKTINFLRRAKA